MDDEIQEAEGLDDKYAQNVYQIQQSRPRLKTSTPVSTGDIRSTDVNCNLPKLILPVFSRGCMEWKSLIDLLEGAVIYNARLPKSQNYST